MYVLLFTVAPIMSFLACAHHFHSHSLHIIIIIFVSHFPHSVILLIYQEEEEENVGTIMINIQVVFNGKIIKESNDGNIIWQKLLKTSTLFHFFVHLTSSLIISINFEWSEKYMRMRIFHSHIFFYSPLLKLMFNNFCLSLPTYQFYALNRQWMRWKGKKWEKKIELSCLIAQCICYCGSFFPFFLFLFPKHASARAKA